MGHIFVIFEKFMTFFNQFLLFCDLLFHYLPINVFFYVTRWDRIHFIIMGSPYSHELSIFIRKIHHFENIA
jgi:hypothetical protein